MIRARLLFGLALAGCGPPRPAPDDEAHQPAAVSDSLILTTGAGYRVYFSASREGRDSTGRSCTEWAMAVRRDSGRTAIPLLYTGETPRIINDSTIEAAIWLHCRPGNRYRVNLATGYPSRVR